MLVIIHGNIRTMEDKDYEDGYLQIDHGKIVSIGDMNECNVHALKADDHV